VLPVSIADCVLSVLEEFIPCRAVLTQRTLRRVSTRRHFMLYARPVVPEHFACASAWRAFLMPEGSAVFTVRGRSMYPALEPGRRVRLKTPDLPLRAGRCYAFIHRRRIVVHRLVCRCGSDALFAGDRGCRYERAPMDSVVGELDYQYTGERLWLVAAINSFFAHIREWFPAADRWRSRLVRATAGPVRGGIEP